MRDVAEPSTLKPIFLRVVEDIAAASGMRMADLGDQSEVYAAMEERGSQAISELSGGARGTGRGRTSCQLG